MKTNKQRPEQRRADAANAQEFNEITKFVAECRRHWPSAMIVLRPDGAPEQSAVPCQASCAHFLPRRTLAGR
jgi:hypothetical protein